MFAGVRYWCYCYIGISECEDFLISLIGMTIKYFLSHKGIVFEINKL